MRENVELNWSQMSETFSSGDGKNLSEVRRLRFAAGELEFIDAAAKRDNTTFSAVVRRIIRAEAGLVPIVDEALRPEISAMNEQLRKIGINLNQAVRAMNEGRVNYEADLERALIAVGELVVQQRMDLRDALKTPRKPKPSSEVRGE